MFEDAYFGKWYRTRDGQKAIYIAKHISTSIYTGEETYEHTYALKDRCTVHWCKDNGRNLSFIEEFDIVEPWPETSDSEIEKLAYESRDGSTPNDFDYRDGYFNGFRESEQRRQ